MGKPTSAKANILVIRRDDLDRRLAQIVAVQFAARLKNFAPAQKAASFAVDCALAKMAHASISADWQLAEQ